MFSDEQTASFEISHQIVVMLLTRDKFAGFHDRETAKPNAPREVLNVLGAGSERDVDELIRRIRQASGAVSTTHLSAEGGSFSILFHRTERS